MRVPGLVIPVSYALGLSNVDYQASLTAVFGGEAAAAAGIFRAIYANFPGLDAGLPTATRPIVLHPGLLVDDSGAAKGPDEIQSIFQTVAARLNGSLPETPDKAQKIATLYSQLALLDGIILKTDPLHLPFAGSAHDSFAGARPTNVLPGGSPVDFKSNGIRPIVALPQAEETKQGIVIDFRRAAIASLKVCYDPKSAGLRVTSEKNDPKSWVVTVGHGLKRAGHRLGAMSLPHGLLFQLTPGLDGNFTLTNRGIPKGLTFHHPPDAPRPFHKARFVIVTNEARLTYRRFWGIAGLDFLFL